MFVRLYVLYNVQILHIYSYDATYAVCVRCKYVFCVAKQLVLSIVHSIQFYACAFLNSISVSLCATGSLFQRVTLNVFQIGNINASVTSFILCFVMVVCTHKQSNKHTHCYTNDTQSHISECEIATDRMLHGVCGWPNRKLWQSDLLLKYIPTNWFPLFWLVWFRKHFFVAYSLFHLFFCWVHFCIEDVFQPNKLKI